MLDADTFSASPFQISRNNSGFAESPYNYQDPAGQLYTGNASFSQTGFTGYFPSSPSPISNQYHQDQLDVMSDINVQNIWSPPNVYPPMLVQRMPTISGPSNSYTNMAEHFTRTQALRDLQTRASDIYAQQPLSDADMINSGRRRSLSEGSEGVKVPKSSDTVGELQPRRFLQLVLRLLFRKQGRNCSTNTRI